MSDCLFFFYFWFVCMFVGAYNAIWNVMEQAIEDNKLMACGRYVPDPYNDKVDQRKGIDLGILHKFMLL